VSKTNTTPQRHDKRAIKEFLTHAAGELRMQELALDGKPVPPKLQQGVTERRAKFGSELLPDAGLLCFLASDPEEDDDTQRDAARRAMVRRRQEQMKQVVGVMDLLGELEM
jgi:hypothetical protein